MELTIREKAWALVCGVHSDPERSERICRFVRDGIPYCLDEWDVKPAEVFRKMGGMCAGKTLLAAELHRAVGILVRFRVIKIMGEEGLFAFVTHQLEEGACLPLPLEKTKRMINNILLLPPDRDHILLEVLLNGQRVSLDLARDTKLDHGMRVLGLWQERKVVSEEGTFDSLDQWLENRMQRRAILQDRELFFKIFNQQLEKIRLAGESGLQGKGSEHKQKIYGVHYKQRDIICYFDRWVETILSKTYFFINRYMNVPNHG